MREILTLAGLILWNISIGVFHRLIYSPQIKNMHNRRTQSMATPIIGVLMNALPFTTWVALLRNANDGDDRKSSKLSNLLNMVMVYLMSFMWYGAGVVLGMIFGDIYLAKTDRWNRE